MKSIQFIEKNFSSRDVFVSDNELWVKDIWYTLQGEGPFAGFPAVFIRLAGCNRGAKIDCDFCDTNFLMSESQVLSIEAIANKVFALADGNTGLVVITGGEPMMHTTLAALVTHLQGLGFLVQIETNGDYVREDSLPGAVIVVSPKASIRGYTKPPAGMLQRADFLKFVVTADEDSFYHSVPDYAHEFVDGKEDPSALFVSPMNEYQRPLAAGEIASIWSNAYDREKCARNHAYAAELAMKLGCRLSLQTHAYVSVP